MGRASYEFKKAKQELADESRELMASAEKIAEKKSDQEQNSSDNAEKQG